MRELLKLTVPGEIFTMEYDVGAQWHGHMQWEFTLFPEGNCVNYVEGASFPTPKNTVMPQRTNTPGGRVRMSCTSSLRNSISSV